VARLPDDKRNGAEAIGSIMVPTAAGERLPLSRLADIKWVEGPATITREMGQRRIVVSTNVRGRDIGSFCGPRLKKQLKENLALPPGRYFLRIRRAVLSHLQRARTRLMFVVPLAAVLIFGLLYATYQNVVDALRVFTGVPFGWVGGIFACGCRDMPFSISAAIGLLALSGERARNIF